MKGFLLKLLAVLIFSTLQGCNGVLDPKGPVAASEKLILLNSLAVMLAIVVPVILATFAFAWWFRASNHRAQYRPEWAFSGSIEMIVWSIPTLVITFLGGIAWFGSHALDPYRALRSNAVPIEIEVVSLDWKWLFIYPKEHIGAVNTLVIPAGAPIHFKITSASVWNTFFIPQLGSMIYSMAGMVTQLNLQADAPGNFRGMSGMLSGEKFVDMHFQVQALSTPEYNRWLQRARASGNVLNDETYAKLAQVQDTSAVRIYGSVEPTLFMSIVSGTAPESAGARQL